MTAVVWAAALVAAAIHLLVFVWEVLVFDRPGVHRGIFGVATEDVPAVRLWSIGVGFYNLFLACGPVVALVLWASGDERVARGLLLYCSLFMALSGVVLLVMDRMAVGRPRGSGLGGAAAQSLPPLVVIAALAAA